MERVRAHVLVAGRVQGVFFRAYTQEEALRRHLTGWVRNRQDGSVEAVFEGKRAEVEGLITWCRSGPPSARVTKVETTLEEYTGEFTGFSITH
jgi:acylphosphatase